MKKNRLVKGMTGLAAAVLLVIPAGLSHQSVLAAQAEKEAAVKYEAQEESLEDYDLVVIQEDPVPLAPFAEPDYDGAAVRVVSLSLLILMSGGYGLWYLTRRRRILALSVNLPDSEAKEVRENIPFFHPLKAAQIEREIEDRIAGEFVKR